MLMFLVSKIIYSFFINKNFYFQMLSVLGDEVMITKNLDDIVKGKYFCLVFIKLKRFKYKKINYNNCILIIKVQ